jgi:hypothetical protein
MMEGKTFSELTIKEKFILQGVMKKARAGRELTAEEDDLRARFAAEFEAVERQARSRWPIILLLVITGALGLLRSCPGSH